jgi:hypothetical protein
MKRFLPGSWSLAGWALLLVLWAGYESANAQSEFPPFTSVNWDVCHLCFDAGYPFCRKYENLEVECMGSEPYASPPPEPAWPPSLQFLFWKRAPSECGSDATSCQEASLSQGTRALSSTFKRVGNTVAGAAKKLISWFGDQKANANCNAISDPLQRMNCKFDKGMAIYILALDMFLPIGPKGDVAERVAFWRLAKHTDDMFRKCHMTGYCAGQVVEVAKLLVGEQARYSIAVVEGFDPTEGKIVAHAIVKMFYADGRLAGFIDGDNFYDHRFTSILESLTKHGIENVKEIFPFTNKGNLQEFVTWMKNRGESIPAPPPVKQP